MRDAAGRTRQEVAAIINILSKLTGITSGWNGEIELSQGTRALGRKPFTCQIVLSESLAASTKRAIRLRSAFLRVNSVLKEKQP